MKKVIWLAAVVVLVSVTGLLPFAGTDIAKLHPVEVLIVSKNEDDLLLQTDSGMVGTGNNVEEALESLRLSSAGNIFLDTANYLIISPDIAKEITSLSDYLRPACQVYHLEGKGKVAEIGKYLECHPSQITVLDYLQGKMNIPLLIMEGESIRIEQG